VFLDVGRTVEGVFGNPAPQIAHPLFIKENPIVKVDVTPPGIARYGNTLFY
jgi:hypothetical protein